MNRYLLYAAGGLIVLLGLHALYENGSDARKLAKKKEEERRQCCGDPKITRSSVAPCFFCERCGMFFCAECQRPGRSMWRDGYCKACVDRREDRIHE